MKEKIRVGIIGCGGIANGKHMPSLSKLDNVEMVAFCDIKEERALKAAKDYGIDGAKTYNDYRKLLEDKSIDVVHVCTPNKSHADITVDALEAGKHVMCEKPMAKTASDAKRMLDAAKKTGKKLTIGYQNRFRPDSQYLHKLCQDGELGEIYFAKAHAIRRRAVPTWGVFLNAEEQGGGPLIDIGTHALDLTLWMMNNYKPKYVVGNTYHKLAERRNSANAWGPWDPDKFTVEDSAFGFITMENGATIILESSWALNSLDVDEAKTTLCGTEGGADMKDGLRINGEKNGRLYTTKIDLSSGGVAFYEGKAEDAADLEARLWIESIINDTEPVVKPEEAYVVSQILEAIYTSSKTGKPVYFNE
ncbi:Gfo/Idh/MocA family oxidoreductase [Thermoanaerobacterium thermosaccharolyticum]|uniref:Gfo/Idh/MocA family oxidoreductase n=1 Tax=Thermoanaerobacterium thermosaccharolyticum TaxID=1517 RepID=UPI00177C3EF6|nr:Gfo/Idh/MocA family oxidoreductase [Thermoanaerobacterium thermosaccharolyticum]MBE0228389.1 Gfo/Idh/MocA family oxidoreductase [Thermoanaerobacterium thermosaccharolyticum]MCP2239370.1 putative dehydrogenase [Thermoanaerobacterium thermosaccharolyticum]